MWLFGLCGLDVCHNFKRNKKFMFCFFFMSEGQILSKNLYIPIYMKKVCFVSKNLNLTETLQLFLVFHILRQDFQ